MLYRSFILVSILFVTSCIDQKDYTLDSLTVTPTVAVPVAFGDIKVLDFASDKDSAYFKAYPDGLLYFSYRQTIDARQIRALFDLPANNSFTTGFDLIPGTLPPSSSDTDFGFVNKQIDLGFSPGQLTEMLLKGSSAIKCTIGLSQATSPTLPYEINFVLTDIVDKDTQTPLSFTAASGTTTKSLNNYLIKMSQNRFDIKASLVLKKRSSSVFIPPGTKVNIQLSFVTDFSYIKGFFGDQVVAIPSQTEELTIFNSALNKAKLSFVDPVVKISVRNDHGVPAEINFSSILAKKDNVTIPFQLNPANPITLNSPATLGTFATTTVAVANANDIVALSPTQLSYTASVRINKGLSSGTNFMADTSRLHISMITEIPLNGHFSGYPLADTMNIDLSSVEKSAIISSSLKVKAVNQMPLDANIQLYLTDKNYHIIDSLFSPNQTLLVKASSVTNTGELQTATTSDVKLDLLPDKVEKLFSASYIIVKSKMSTAKDASGGFLNVKFKSTYKLTMNVGLLAKLNITSK